MMEMIAGSPFFLVAASGFITAILVFMYFQTNDSRLVPFIVCGVILTLAPVLIDALITTERESLKRTIQRLTRAVRHNDVAAALEFTHPDAKEVYARIEDEMPNYDFTSCNITGFRNIDISDDASEAVVTFRVFVNVKAKRGPEGVGSREIVLDMRKLSEGDWRITDYRHYGPLSRQSGNRDKQRPGD